MFKKIKYKIVIFFRKLENYKKGIIELKIIKIKFIKWVAY